MLRHTTLDGVYIFIRSYNLYWWLIFLQSSNPTSKEGVTYKIICYLFPQVKFGLLMDDKTSILLNDLWGNWTIVPYETHGILYKDEQSLAWKTTRLNVSLQPSSFTIGENDVLLHNEIVSPKDLRLSVTFFHAYYDN